MRKKWICALLAAALLCLGLSGCALFQTRVEDMPEEEAAPYYALSDQLLQALFNEDYTACTNMFSENLRNTLPASDLQSAWEQTRLNYGDPVQVESRKPYRINGEGTVVSQVLCAHGACSVQITFDKDNGVAGLWFGLPETQADYAVAVPEGVVEEEIVLGEGTDTPLRAIITRPAGQTNAAIPGVVLVHGSGASDRNEAIGNCYPFADIAHGLALQGIASIRYDKRTYTYGDTYTQEQVDAMTVQEEVIDDALLAIDALRNAPGVDPNAVVLAGHSLGGMLAPRIAQLSDGKVAGVISLAGTARGYLDVVYDQNLDAATEDKQLAAIKKEYRKVEKLDTLKDSETVFGIPVPYLKDLYAHPVEESLQALDVPFLILQGDSDFQMHTEDYKSWQTALEDYAPGAEFHLFEGLNHLFADSTGSSRRGSVAEYLDEGHVAQEVIDTMASWISEKLA